MISDYGSFISSESFNLSLSSIFNGVYFLIGSSLFGLIRGIFFYYSVVLVIGNELILW